MKAQKSFVLVEHQVSGQVLVAEYNHAERILLINGEPARLADYWAVCELAQVPREQQQEARP
jgi:hypothetical protein